MSKSGILSQDVGPLRVTSQHSLRRLSSKFSQVATGQHISPTVFPEKRGKVKLSQKKEVTIVNGNSENLKAQKHSIDLGNEQSDLLAISGKLVLEKRISKKNSDEPIPGETTIENALDAKLTSKALIWGSQYLPLDDVISVSYSSRLRYFTVHAYPLKERPCGFAFLMRPRRFQKDYRFLASSVDEAFQWVQGFANQQCFVNFLPHPLESSKKQGSDAFTTDFPLENIKCRNLRSVLIILNPRSGRGRSCKVFHDKVEPIFKLAGFKMEVVKTTSAGHAKNLASTVDLSTCPDGIICVGGDGIVNEVLNGLLSRDNQKEAISIPIGIIPAGSDNSLVWTVLGVRDPISAALSIVKGGLTATDVFVVEWIQSGAIHFGTTVSYYGFVSEVLELSEKFQKRFGPLRYFVAGVLKFLCLPKYSFEVEYLPISKPRMDSERNSPSDHGPPDLYPDIMRKSRQSSLPRASSLSSIDSMMSPNQTSGDLDTTSSTHASSEPSDIVRGLDPKAKRLSLGRNNAIMEPEEVLHPQLQLSTTPNWPRTRSKSRMDKGWSGMTVVNDSRCVWGNMGVNDKEDISSTMSDPGPIWDSEPKWDTEPNWGNENLIELPRKSDDLELGLMKEVVSKSEEKWVAIKGEFLGILVCNHACRTVQSLNSLAVAPKAEHDDGSLDLLIVHGNGRLRLLRFFLLMQFGRHISLPFVEYIKVKTVKIKPSKAQCGCGIDGELFIKNGQIISNLFPEQCSLLGRPRKDQK